MFPGVSHPIRSLSQRARHSSLLPQHLTSSLDVASAKRVGVGVAIAAAFAASGAKQWLRSDAEPR